jgi:hypothetical protein
METGTDSKRRHGRVDEAAKLRFVEAIRAGAPREEAAASAGFTATAFYYARERDPVFRRAWLWALELSGIDERSSRAAASEPAPPHTIIAPNANRRLQRRVVRRRLFDDARKRIFLDNFAGTADAHAAAAAAGVGYSTVVQHRRKDPEFADAWDEALHVAYALLEAETLRQRLEAQQRFREAPCPTGEMTKEFDRALQLLARYRRPDGRLGMRETSRGRERRWSFDEAIHALDAKLRAMGVRYGITGVEPIALPAPEPEEAPRPHPDEEPEDDPEDDE